MSYAQSSHDRLKTGLPWAPDVPSDWTIKKGKFLFDVNKRPVKDGDEIVTAFRDGQVTLRKNRRTDGFTNAMKEIGYQRVLEGDLVIHAMDAFAGAVGVSDATGKCTPVYSCCTPREDVSPGFYARMIRTMALSGFIESLAKGIRERSTNFSWNEFSEQPLPVPPYEQQLVINRYLDRETARIDGLIEKKTQLIALLKEKRAAVITHAVTKGIDAGVEMKEGGLKAHGTIPAHWNLSPVGRALKLTKRTVGARHAEFTLLSLTTRGIIKRDISESFGKFPESFDTYQEVRQGDFVFCLFDIDETPRTIGLSGHDGMITGAYSVFECIEPAFRDYLLHLFLHLDGCKGLKPFYSGLRKTIRPPKFRSIRVPFPPADEAQRIVEHIEKKSAKIDSLITKTDSSIALLREKRAALITAAVTGKIDVRHTE